MKNIKHPGQETDRVGLADISDEMLINILTFQTLHTVMNVSFVCKGWYLPPDRTCLWEGLAHARGIEMRGGKTGRSSRAASNPKMNFFKRAVITGKGLPKPALNVQALMEFVRKGGCIDRDFPLTKDGVSCRRLVHIAAKHSQFDCLKYLAMMRADLNTGDGMGFTPLMHAAIEGHKKCVIFLLEQNVNLHASCKLSQSGPFTAAQWARRWGKDAIANIIERNSGGTGN